MKKIGLNTPPCGIQSSSLFDCCHFSWYITFLSFKCCVLNAQTLSHFSYPFVSELFIFFCIDFSSNSLRTLSNAIAISSAKSIGRFIILCFLKYFINILTLYRLTSVLIPAWNPTWYLFNFIFSHSMHHSSFYLITFSISLFGRICTAIGLVLSTLAIGLLVFVINISSSVSILFENV